MAGRERRSGLPQQQQADDIENGNDLNMDGDGHLNVPVRKTSAGSGGPLGRMKKVSAIITDEMIRELREQDYPKPTKPIYGIYIAVAIACVITIIVVPSAYAAAKPGKAELVATTAADAATPAALQPRSPTMGDITSKAQTEQPTTVTTKKLTTSRLTTTAVKTTSKLTTAAGKTTLARASTPP